MSLLNALKRLHISFYASGISQTRILSTRAITNTNNLEVTRKEWKFPPQYVKAREVWIESLDTVEPNKLGILELHPAIYAFAPRIDIIHKNVTWQKKYRWVSWAHTKTRAEVRGGGRKPHPQKGLGRARAGSIRSPLWRGGGIVHGPRSGKTHFYMLPFHERLYGLMATLSVKLAQDDLHIIRDLSLPNDESKYLAELIEDRNWGPSVLFVDDYDIMPRNITAATNDLQHVNLMPAYGLNVYSMLKHDTLVLTISAAEKIQDKLLHHLNSITKTQQAKFKLDQI